MSESQTGTPYPVEETHIEECPSCGAEMRLGDGWEGVGTPECPGCYDGADTWTDDPRIEVSDE